MLRTKIQSFAMKALRALLGLVVPILRFNDRCSATQGPWSHHYSRRRSYLPNLIGIDRAVSQFQPKSGKRKLRTNAYVYIIHRDRKLKIKAALQRQTITSFQAVKIWPSHVSHQCKTNCINALKLNRLFHT